MSSCFPFSWQAKSLPKGFTVCELMLVIASIGTLLSLLLPAIICAREATRRIVCTSQLHELGTAIHAYHDVHLRFPTAWHTRESEPGFLLGWATEILPELGEQSIAVTYRSAPNPNETFGHRSPRRFLCPSDITEPTFVLRAPNEPDLRTTTESITDSPQEGKFLRNLPTANYVGVFGTTEADEQNPSDSKTASRPGDGPIVHDRHVRVADLKRGTSKTLLVGERTMAMVPSTWLGVDVTGVDSQCRLVGSAMTTPNCQECDECEFSSRHAGGANFVWADGHVELMKDSVDTAIYRRFAQRSVE